MELEAGFTFYDENNNILNHEWTEREEQHIVEKLIKEDYIVLELGARYGTVSCRINRKLKDSKNQVSVEPDPLVWDALEKNRSYNNCNFYILKGVISKTPVKFINMDNPYAGFTEKTDVESCNRLALDELESLCNLKFNTLIADCEGFLGQFFEENPHMYQQLHTVFFEKDGIHICDYDKIKENLQKNNFRCILVLHSSHEVWVKHV
jgi:FkbM family methyltransferase